MDHNSYRANIFDALQIFIIDSVLEQNPKAKLNTELLETIRADCECIEEVSKTHELNGFSLDVKNDYRDVVMEFFFDELILTPGSVLLNVFQNVSDIQFRMEKDEEENKDLLIMTITYDNLFSE